MSDDWLLREGDRDPPGGPFHCRGAQWLMDGHNIFQREWYPGPVDGNFGARSADAARRCKFEIGYTLASVLPTFGPQLRDYLTGKTKRSLAMRRRAAARRTKFIWPTRPHGVVIGFPGYGTHSYSQPPNNWESDKAWDINVPIGSLIVATADGRIGPAFGPLPNPDPRFDGIRVHLETADNEFYYAHLSSTARGLGPGDRVTQGQTLGLSGQANGVAHLHFGLKHLIPLASFR